MTRAWETRAACRTAGLPLDAWFPEPGHPVDPAALRVCWACPVREDCLEHAIETRETDGVWGGLSAKQRRSLIRSRARDASRARRAALRGTT